MSQQKQTNNMSPEVLLVLESKFSYCKNEVLHGCTMCMHFLQLMCLALRLFYIYADKTVHFPCVSQQVPFVVLIFPVWNRILLENF